MSYSAAWPPQSKLGYPTTLLRMFKVQMSLRQVTCVIAEAHIRDRDWLFESLIGKSCCLKENKRKHELALNLHEGSAGDRRHHLVANAYWRSAIWDLGIWMRRSRPQNARPNTRLQSQSREKASIAIFVGKSQRHVWDFTGQASNQVTKTTLDGSCQERHRESEWMIYSPPGRKVTRDWRDGVPTWGSLPHSGAACGFVCNFSEVSQFVWDYMSG